MKYQLTFEIRGRLQSVIVDGHTWEDAHALGLWMLAKMRSRNRGQFALVGVGFCVYGAA